mmetsp:Transcript_1424/g.2530  ORF Transcript_1424/g.2530 Transcript_1424/m.2530 type:complete len:218 (+) Transcript_1424:122-775(+)|eukprot:CAMPEP_0202832864 /NCGR_PEP_ID=MMETSP1389-20130828/21800_1 /ASSEMBLY_ACC=CAM_ASM_000865 /TAXON_ID=302021 /ORGANISM="Rhodomonas sp., Strain CCMP768" /LENGTH=217 /DNA_ID=CAMNT_0049507131 /DNA_START=121 /DNA_END=774 /DNA_ORIENTATION=+
MRLQTFVCFTLALFQLSHAQQDDHALDCYDGPFETVLLDGCVDDCRSFETLVEAEQHCNLLDYACGGITKTAYGDQDAINLGVGLYEVRSGPGIEQQVGDMTWIKQDGCSAGQLPHPDAGYDQNLGHPQGDWGQPNNYAYDQQWDQQMDNVGDAYTSAFVQMFWMAFILAVIAGAVFFSYKRGDQITVDYVDRFRERMGRFMQERGPRVNEGSYESL